MDKNLRVTKFQNQTPETMMPFENSDTKEDTPQLTDTLTGVLPISPPGEEEKMKEQCNLNNSDFFSKSTQMIIQR